MAVAFDASSNINFNNINTTPPVDITNFMTVGSGSNRAMVLYVDCGSNGAGLPAGFALTWDQGGTNQTPTQITGTLAPNTGNGGTCALYGLLAPTSGLKTLRVNWTSGTNEFHVAAVTFTGVDQTSPAVAFPHGNKVSHPTLTAGPASVTITSTSGNMVVGGFAQNGAPWGAISGTTIAKDDITGPNEGVAANWDNGAATVTLTAAFTGTTFWDAIGCDVLAAGGAAAIAAKQLIINQARVRASYW